MSEEHSRAYRGWRMVAVCFAVATLAWGFGFYGQGVYLAHLLKLRGWSLSLVSGAVTGFYFVSAIMVAFVADWIARFGAPRVIAGGMIATGAAVAALGLVREAWQLYAVYLLMSLGWASTSLAAITTVLGMWFSARRGLAVSLALTGASAGGILVVPAVQALIDAKGFETAMLVGGTLLVLVGAPLALWLIEAPAAPSAAGEARPAAQRKGELLRSFRFWSIAGAFAIVWVTQTAFLTHEINIFAPVLGTSGAAAAVAATTLAAVAGRLAMGSVVDRLDKRLTTALSVVSQAAALVALVLWPQPAVIWAAAMVYGLSVGNVITLPALIVQHEFDPRAFGGVVALLTSVTQMFGAFGPALLGLGRDLAGGYGPPIVCCALLNVCAGAAVLLLRPGPRHA
ncbi:MAG: MFS transporter [Methylobacteriaceae bacterium]|nr:MFS transporter [Rhodoblastus sp.]MCC0003336.1 MFS transporter [Methylobacteriaceae bacterium]